MGGGFCELHSVDGLPVDVVLLWPLSCLRFCQIHGYDVTCPKAAKNVASFGGTVSALTFHVLRAATFRRQSSIAPKINLRRTRGKRGSCGRICDTLATLQSRFFYLPHVPARANMTGHRGVLALSSQ